jgi:hypothetical protein
MTTVRDEKVYACCPEV